ncbi:NAD(P)-binding protein [Kribbella sp. CA-253562]|uniref:NAD(P)-binding protein n=1 Tax=Kribbella sp. CA-253562 TaxID=3239942 RepID=UPI003D8D439E
MKAKKTYQLGFLSLCETMSPLPDRAHSPRERLQISSVAGKKLFKTYALAKLLRERSSPAVAVVGSGVAGVTAAYLLSRTCRVTVFETDVRPSRHTPHRLRANAFTPRS